jgi:septal ring factor EnvC (AmiA/AmiB activator)
MQRMPGWFRAVFVTVMLLTCAILCWYAASQHQLRFQVADLTLSLDTSRQREVKQQYEYDQVVAEIPLVQAQVAELEPQAAAAQAIEKDLRAQRKALRAENADLQKQLESLQAEVADLREQEQQLRDDVEALRQQLQ